MATPGAGTDGVGAPQVETAVRRESATRDHGLGHGAVAWRAAEPPAPWSAGTPWADDGRAEEVAVCELCGLVSRPPLPEVCPACGGGYG